MLRKFSRPAESDRRMARQPRTLRLEVEAHPTQRTCRQRQGYRTASRPSIPPPGVFFGVAPGFSTQAMVPVPISYHMSWLWFSDGDSQALPHLRFHFHSLTQSVDLFVRFKRDSLAFFSYDPAQGLQGDSVLPVFDEVSHLIRLRLSQGSMKRAEDGEQVPLELWVIVTHAFKGSSVH